MNAVARHAGPDGRLEVADQFELGQRWCVAARAAPERPDAEILGGAGIEMSDRMNPERKRDMHQVFLGRPHDHEGATEAEDAVFHVERGARIKQRAAGDASRAPILDHLAARLDTELLVKLVRRDLPQFVLGEERNFRPNVRIVQSIEIDTGQPIAKERGAQCKFHGAPLARLLDRFELRSRARPIRNHRHHRIDAARAAKPHRDYVGSRGPDEAIARLTARSRRHIRMQNVGCGNPAAASIPPVSGATPTGAVAPRLRQWIRPCELSSVQFPAIIPSHTLGGE